jgi:hypothetical protein
VGPTCERRLRHEVRPHHAIFSQENPQAEIWIDAIYCMRLVVDSFFKRKEKDEENPKWSRSKTTLYHKKFTLSHSFMKCGL